MPASRPGAPTIAFLMFGVGVIAVTLAMARALGLTLLGQVLFASLVALQYLGLSAIIYARLWGQHKP